jgi:hypothetical protein
MVMDSNLLQVLDSPPFPFSFPGQLAERPANGSYGLLDGARTPSRQSAEPWRYYTCFVSLTAVAGANASLAAAQAFTAFDKGTGEDTTQASYGALSLADTDANVGGSFGKQQEQFVLRSLGVQVEAPFILSGSEKQYPAWLADGYQKRIQTAFLNNFAVRYSYADTECAGDLGLIKLWPQHAASNGETYVKNAEPIGPAVLTPFRRPLLAGSNTSNDKMTLTLLSGKAFRIDGDPVQPIPVGVTAIVVPVQFVVYGYPITKPQCSPACLLPDGRIVVAPLMQPQGGQQNGQQTQGGGLTPAQMQLLQNAQFDQRR